MKIMTKILLGSGLVLMAHTALANCTVNQNHQVNFGKYSSIQIYDGRLSSQVFNSGFACRGLVAVANWALIKYKVNNLPSNLTNSANGDVLNISFRDDNNASISQGVENILSKFDFLTLFNGPDNSIPFYATINPGQNVSPGVYESKTPFNLRWYYSVPDIAIFGVGRFFESPGFERGAGSNVRNWGAGEAATTNFKITIDPDCRISVQDVNLGTAVFANQLDQVYTDVGVRCSSRTPYSVAINDGSHSNGGQRRLKSTSSNHYINYDIYKNFYDQRWGSTGTQPWISDHATNNGGVYDGKTIQIFKMRTKVTPNNPENLPGGQYTDRLRMEIRF